MTQNPVPPPRVGVARAPRWCAADDRELIERYRAGESRAVIASAIGRSVDAVDSRRRALGLTRRSLRGGGWTPREEAFLLAAARDNLPPPVIARSLGRSVDAVRARRRQLHGRRPAARTWQPHEDEQLRASYARNGDIAALAAALQRSPDAIRLRATQHGLVVRGTRRRWQPHDDELLRSGYRRGMSYAKIAAELLPQRSVETIGARARALGLATGARRWRREEDKHLRNLLQAGSTTGDAANALRRTPEAIRLRARKLGLPLPPRRRSERRRWRPEDDQYLRSSAGLDPGALARALGRSDMAVRRRMLALGLREASSGSPHFDFTRGDELLPGQLRLIERDYAPGNGRMLMSLSRRLERTPAEIKRAAQALLGGPGDAA